MKISKLIQYKTKLLKLKLLTTKIYKNQKNLNYLLLKDAETRLKKVLHIIYRFHAANKKILFIGTPLRLNSQIKRFLKRKKHSFIPEKTWMNGVITNPGPSFKHLLKCHAVNTNKNAKFLFNFKNQVDLIIILNEKLNLIALKESSLKRVPTISLNSDYNSPDINLSTYKTIGDFNFNGKEIRNNIFFLLLSSLLKKAEILRKRQLQTNAKPKKSKIRKKKWNQTY